jgi:hypothetical protein
MAAGITRSMPTAANIAHGVSVVWPAGGPAETTSGVAPLTGSAVPVRR